MAIRKAFTLTVGHDLQPQEVVSRLNCRSKQLLLRSCPLQPFCCGRPAWVGLQGQCAGTFTETMQRLVSVVPAGSFVDECSGVVRSGCPD